MAHRLAYEIPPHDRLSVRLGHQIEMLLSDLKVAMSGSDLLGYCSQKRLREEGITALLTANISRCFSEYCRCMGHGNEIEDRVSIMHQSTLRRPNVNWFVDISLFYRFLTTDKGFVHSHRAALFPLLFIEFTKTSTSKPIDKKLPQAALYANQLFSKLMAFEKSRTWVPLLAIVMSEHEMWFRLYSPSVVNREWKIAEVDVMRCAVSKENMLRLLHVMVGWTRFCTQFLCSPAAVPPPPPSQLNGHLLLRKHCNVVVMGTKIFKSYDYRVISQRWYVEPDYRRDPLHYLQSDLQNVELVVDWTADSDSHDRLQILAYDMVPGVHYPSFVRHLTLVMSKIAQLHARGIVHGDLRFANIVFSDKSDETVAITIIDYDYSGPAGEKVYPPRFRHDITDGFRHDGARAYEYLHPEHDIAALHWMCDQYHPKNVGLRETWRLCVSELLDGTPPVDVAAHLVALESEALEPVDKNMMVSSNITQASSLHEDI